MKRWKKLIVQVNPVRLSGIYTDVNLPVFPLMARGTAMSLIAFCFMGGGGIGTAIGGRIIASHSYTTFFSL